MTLSLDTSGYSQFAANTKAAVDIMETADSLAISTVVLGELFAGFRRGTREKVNRKLLDEFVKIFDVEILPVTGLEADWYATVIQQLKAAGKPIPTNDVWIAATALSAGASLLTADRHFDAVPGLNVIKLPVELK